MPKFFLIPLVALIGIGLYHFGRGSQADQEAPPDTAITDESSGEVSLQAFSKRKFSGSDFKVGRILETHSSYTRYFITYKSEGLTISGIMNKPNGDGPFPVLVLNHGHIDTAVYTNGRGLRREQDFFAKNRYAVVHPDYRNHAASDKDETTDGGDFRFGYTADAINVVNALRSSNLPYLDTRKIGMLGHSMGGGITQNILVTQPSLIKAAVLYAPVSSDVRDNFEKWTRQRREIAETVIRLYGEPKDNPLFWDNLSPINFVERIEVPIMIHHGSRDDSTALAWSERFVEALRKANREVTFHVYEGERHEFSFGWSDFMNRSLEFFNRHLG